MTPRLAAALASVRAVLSAAGAVGRDWTPDALLVAGAAAIAYGAWLIYPPAGFIVGGLLLIVGGYLGAAKAGAENGAA